MKIVIKISKTGLVIVFYQFVNQVFLIGLYKIINYTIKLNYGSRLNSSNYSQLIGIKCSTNHVVF